MIRRPPRSTLFPTRRSSDLDGHGREANHERPYRVEPDAQEQGRNTGQRLQSVQTRGTNHAEISHRDRKSTRLNSSHANISYAVFCLKKKMKIRRLHV